MKEWDIFGIIQEESVEAVDGDGKLGLEPRLEPGTAIGRAPQAHDGDSILGQRENEEK